MEALARIEAYDPLRRLNEAETTLVWRHRSFLTSSARALPKFLLSVPWNNADAVQEAHRLLDVWQRPTPIDALQLLDTQFPDPRVRAYAVSCLESFSDDDLKLYLLQLSQVLKFEPFLDSSLARFLLRRALRRPRLVGHVFFWYLKAEMHLPEVAPRYGALLEQYLRACGEHRTELGHQMFVLTKLQDISRKVKLKDSKAERKATIASELPQIVFPEAFQLPLSPHMVASELVVDKCKVMSSKKLPLWLVFKGASDSARRAYMGEEGTGEEAPLALPPAPDQTISVLFKAGDDLRQDQLTLQVLHIMNGLWQEGGLDLRMSPYGCVSTGDELGMLQVVMNSATLAGISADAVDKKHQGKKKTSSTCATSC
jgi:phosphatidylinositol-4,5-bisphosphate 3-kinase